MPTRQEKVPGFAKIMKLHSGKQIFKKHQSVFREWKPDTSDTVDKCLNHDFDVWKVMKFVKDSKDLNAVKHFITDKFTELKELRVGAIAISQNPPQLDIKGFTKLCQMAMIKDKYIN